MGGHGGLNILPQKRWNVYNFDNREKVRKDEEAAAKEEQLKREQSRKRDAEFRLEQLRQARGLLPLAQADAESDELESKSEPKLESKSEPKLESKSNHINLFEGIKIFDPVTVGVDGEEDDKRGAFKKMKMMKKKEEAPKVVLPEDEKYRLGYGVAGKGVKLPWYLLKPSDDSNAESGGDDYTFRKGKEEGKSSSGKKTLEEMREERLRRERREKGRERALVLEKSRRDGAVSRDRGSSRRGLERK
ncbi:uncharacterized protein LOC132304045 [Cornus florida]|uniref:uncharacterized protein LOC132304045 n=1 Tax=Cornus florida TaxID=4283 RepID=UPI00289A05A1|nr:uncharacterized protein LOC132304045 [Cornus florida]XP_059657531.1 uncharacterized protein LOC132304045 [Cornus florida]